MIVCDGACTVFGIHWAIVYVALGILAGVVSTFFMDDDNTFESGLWAILIAGLWPIVVGFLLAVAAFCLLGAILSAPKYLWNLYRDLH